MSEEFVSQLVVGYLKIQRERFSDANDHFNRMLYTKHNPNDDDILWIAKSHIYKKLGKKEEAQMCMKLVTDALENTEIYKNISLKSL
ncbi:MAG: hypothetical protein HOG69_00295 [Thaumarchaeota archaeon]|nr:hypothetical protein [Candidatus Nitrosopelagicus sp.]MBT5992806.1 hypothetical protein [Nitrososphaerota archaeon]MBT6646611.1 hypothetical protein [Nitrososphaerota archaeon]